MAPNGSPLMKWVLLTDFSDLEATKINGAWAYIVKLTDALTIDARSRSELPWSY